MTGKAAARNEILFRNVNERIEDVSATVPRDDTRIEFLCECDRPGCYDKVSVTRAEYESVRAVPTHFVVLPGHEDARVEHVVGSTNRFVIVQKDGEAAREAAETDPRTEN